MTDDRADLLKEFEKRKVFYLTKTLDAIKGVASKPCLNNTSFSVDADTATSRAVDEFLLSAIKFVKIDDLLSLVAIGKTLTSFVERENEQHQGFMFERSVSADERFQIVFKRLSQQSVNKFIFEYSALEGEVRKMAADAVTASLRGAGAIGELAIDDMKGTLDQLWTKGALCFNELMYLKSDIPGLIAKKRADVVVKYSVVNELLAELCEDGKDVSLDKIKDIDVTLYKELSISAINLYLSGAGKMRAKYVPDYVVGHKKSVNLSGLDPQTQAEIDGICRFVSTDVELRNLAQQLASDYAQASTDDRRDEIIREMRLVLRGASGKGKTKWTTQVSAEEVLSKLAYPEVDAGSGFVKKIECVKSKKIPFSTDNFNVFLKTMGKDKSQKQSRIFTKIHGYVEVLRKKGS